MTFVRGHKESTTLHILTPTWSQEYDVPAHGVLCNTTDWCITDDPVGRDDLICGKCWHVWQELCEEFPAATPLAKKLTYEEYLLSEHWQHMRSLAREHYGDSCCLCGSPDQLDVHHRTYDRRGAERLADVIVLCRDCHTRYHDKAA